MYENVYYFSICGPGSKQRCLEPELAPAPNRDVSGIQRKGHMKSSLRAIVRSSVRAET